MDQAAGEVYKLAKKQRDQYSPMQYALFRIFVTAVAGIYVCETRALLRRKRCFYYAIFAEVLPKCLDKQQEMVSD